MDEPFGALDAFARMEMQEEIVRIVKAQRVTAVFVTHDIDEALYLLTTVWQSCPPIPANCGVSFL